MDDARRRLIEQRAAELLTVKEFAALLRVHERTVRRQIRRGLPGVYDFGGILRIDVTEARRVVVSTSA